MATEAQAGMLDPLAQEARRRFTQLAAQPGDDLDLASAALWIAAEACPGLDVPAYLERLEALAARARPELANTADERDAARRLLRFLFEQEAFRGNTDDYYDPRNSFLNEVIDRRRGIPITLAVVFIDIARRLGLDAQGIGFPGHFLAKVVDRAGRVLVIDPFHGSTVSRSECEARLQHALGPEARLDPGTLEAAPTRAILARMLGNLKQIYIRSQELERALACCQRALLLHPEAPHELRDRGLLFGELECFGAAVADLERFLTAAPRDPSAPAVRRVLVDLRERALHIH